MADKQRTASTVSVNSCIRTVEMHNEICSSWITSLHFLYQLHRAVLLRSHEVKTLNINKLLEGDCLLCSICVKFGFFIYSFDNAPFGIKREQNNRIFLLFICLLYVNKVHNLEVVIRIYIRVQVLYN